MLKLSWVRAAVLALAVVLTVVVVQRLGSTSVPVVAAAPGKERLSYVVAPHPDDEWQAWSLVQDRPDVYHVFIVLTRGEGSSYCAGGGYQGQFGERHPLPDDETGSGFGSVGSDLCKAQRLDSWNAWLDAQATLDPALGSADGMQRFRLEHPAAPLADEGAGTSAWQVGPSSARVAFDLGDGDLTEDEVTWAVQTVRQHLERVLPGLPEGDLVGAAYYNSSPSCYEYENTDHLAVHRALLDVDQQVPGAQWGATCRDDPRVRRTETIRDDLYEANMAPRKADPAAEPAALRTGHFQSVYGWLGFPTDYFPSGTDNAVLFSQSQSFWRRE